MLSNYPNKQIVREGQSAGNAMVAVEKPACQNPGHCVVRSDPDRAVLERGGLAEDPAPAEETATRDPPSPNELELLPTHNGYELPRVLALGPVQTSPARRRTRRG